MAKRFLICAIGILFFVLVGYASGPPPTPEAPPDVSAVGTIAPASEPGQRLVVSGTVYAPDGVTPAPGVIVYAYQTDAHGEYHNDAQRVARLHGWAKSDAAGHFEFRTIHPGPYPGRTIAAHIHVHIYGGGYPLQWADGIRFAGDPFVSQEDRQSAASDPKFSGLRQVTRDVAGVEHCTMNIRASKTTNYPAGESLELLRR